MLLPPVDYKHLGAVGLIFPNLIVTKFVSGFLTQVVPLREAFYELFVKFKHVLGKAIMNRGINFLLQPLFWMFELQLFGFKSLRLLKFKLLEFNFLFFKLRNLIKSLLGPLWAILQIFWEGLSLKICVWRLIAVLFSFE